MHFSPAHKGVSMTSFIRAVAAAVLLLSSAELTAQATSVDVYTAEQLASDSAQLRSKPKFSTGLSGETLQKYPNHYTMLIVRDKDGEAELHQNVADVFFIVSGKAELRTGGVMQNIRNTDPGEKRGSDLAGAASVTLKAGDIVHIPANVPHQLRVSSGAGFTYFVVKISEAPAASQPSH